MKKIILTVAFGVAVFATQELYAQQGFGTNNPDKSAAVDIVSTKRGFLIPRISIPDLNQATPINNPATSLFVYNTNATTGAGFYYWDGVKWVRFTSSINEKTYSVSTDNTGKLVVNAPEITGNNVDYKVTVDETKIDINNLDGLLNETKIKPGTDGQVLVTQSNGTELVPTWTNPEDFVKDVVNATNGLTYLPSTGAGVDNIIKLGGSLTENTTITTVNGQTDPADNRSLTIAGLQTVTNATHIMVMDTNGLLQKMERSALLDAKDLSTDGKIVIGADGGPFGNTLANAVLQATRLSIAAESITSGDIKDGTIQATDIKAPGTTTESSTGGTINQVLVTNADGTVTWINQSALANKDAYAGVSPISIAPNTTNPTNADGGNNYDVSVATANGANIGVVKEAATTPTVNINAQGELSVNTENLGKKLTSSTLTISNSDNKALLEDLTLEIKPGTTGQILTTTGSAGSEIATWTTPNSLVEVNNGLNKENSEVIELGGSLRRPTTITTSSDNTLAIKDIVKAPEDITNKAIVADETTGIVRTIDKVVTGTNVSVSANTGYSVHTPEVVINVTLADTDQTITFPDATKAIGQAINIKIANTTEEHTGYLNVLDTYGSMPYQGWIVKSNGTAWVIVGRN